MNTWVAALRAINPEVQKLNQVWLSEILLAQRSGKGCLPNKMGLDAQEYSELLAYCDVPLPAVAAPSNEVQEKADIRQELLDLRQDEWQQLVELLLEHRLQSCHSEPWLAKILASACMGGSHLWKDLGLSNRADLKSLLMVNFPELAERNTKDMRWKKFFYKQLCEQEGGYVCRAPTCEQCSTYQECFGDEL